MTGLRNNRRQRTSQVFGKAVARTIGLEALEERRLFALLGLPLEFPLASIRNADPGALTYSASTGNLVATGTPFELALNSSTAPLAIDAPAGSALQIKLTSGGNAVLPGTPLDFTISGQIDVDDDTIYDYSGVLLTGQVKAFGFEDGGNTDFYDVRLTPTGGLLQSAYFAGKDIGIVIVSENSTFTGSFLSDFNGKVKATVAPIAPEDLLPPPPASISGFVYQDANDNGVFDSGETPIQGATVTLTGIDANGEIIPRTATTDANGFYRFTNLTAGTYSVLETQPLGFLDGKDAVGTVGGTTRGTLGNDTLSFVTLFAGDAGVQYNFGELLPASVSGFVYVDANNNGLKELGETPIEGVSISLFDSLGNLVTSTNTLADGSYFFGNLSPDTYSVVEGTTPAYFDGKDTVGTVAAATVGSLSGTAPIFDALASIVLGQGSAGINYNFGELLPASIAGFVYVDANNDGIKGTSELPISGVSVTLTGTDDLGNAVNTTVNTLTDGSYLFDNLRPGTYTLTESQPAAYVDGKDTIGTPGGSTANDVFTNIVLNAGVNGINNNFGELFAATASISGFVYVDDNNNGVKETGEAPIGSVKVTLTGTTDIGTTVNLVTFTDGNGAYSFSGLRPGNYTVTESQPAAFNDGKDAVGTIGGVTKGTLGNDVLSSIAILAGNVGINYNFGEIAPVVVGSISGQKVLDRTGNGKTADDTGLGGVTIQLYRDVDGDGKVTVTDGSPIRTAVTASNGTYSFTALPAGKYLVKEVITSAYVRTGPTLSDTYVINLAAGQNVGAIDFANYLKGCDCSLSNVYYIINGQTKVTNLRGNTNQGDTVQAFFTIAPGGSATLSLVSYTAPAGSFSASTASQQVIYDVATGTFGPGTYSLTVLNPSSYYQVDFVCGLPIDTFGPAGSNVFYTPQGRLLSADNDGSSTPVAGVSSLSGFVYIDANNNGKFDFGEKPLSNVKITLTGTTTSGQTVSRQVTTDSAGKYVFGGLLGGTYSIAQGTTSSTYTDGKTNAVGTNGGSATKNLFSGIQIGSGNAGAWYNFGEICR